VPEPTPRQAQEPPLVRAIEKHLRHSQRDHRRVIDPRRTPRTGTLREEIISKHIKCDEQGVEVGRHAASLVGVASATPDFDAQPEDHSSAAVKTESTI
jgi:hypothetical protein